MSRGGRIGPLLSEGVEGLAVSGLGVGSDSAGSSVGLVDGTGPKSQFRAIDSNGALACRTALSRVMVLSETFSSCASSVYRRRFVRPYGPAALSGMEIGGSSVDFVRTLRQGTDGNWYSLRKERVREDVGELLFGSVGEGVKVVSV